MNLNDLNRFPVWEFALDEEGEDGQDEATVRPYEVVETLDPDDGLFIVKAVFTLADGVKMQGYLSSPYKGDAGLGKLQPVIVTADGQVGFWYGVVTPSFEELIRNYRLLNRGANDVFPLTFRSQVELRGGPVHGSLPGFLVLEDWESGKVRCVK